MKRKLQLKDAGQHKHLRVPCDFKGIDERGKFSGYASIFGNVDLGGDIVERGAFARADMALNKDGKIRIADGHNLRRIVGLADVSQDDTGLKFEGQLLMELSSARDLHVLMKANAVEEMSIGYDSLEDEVTNAGIRKLKRLKLYEISPVVFAMNPMARIEAVKGQITSIREYEDFLRDVGGYSNAQAKLLASAGWNALQKARDEPKDPAEARDELQADAAQVGSLLDFLKTI
jgi:HK97 family phage prohead protease